MGFTGFVMSDWGATHSTVASANGGLDMEMPGSDYFGDGLSQAVADGTVFFIFFSFVKLKVSEDTINDKVLRILTPMFAVGLFDNPQYGNLRYFTLCCGIDTTVWMLQAQTITH